MTKDDKKYLLEELERFRTYAKSRDVTWIADAQYEGWYPKFHRYHDKKSDEL